MLDLPFLEQTRKWYASTRVRIPVQLQYPPVAQSAAGMDSPVNIDICTINALLVIVVALRCLEFVNTLPAPVPARRAVHACIARPVVQS